MAATRGLALSTGSPSFLSDKNLNPFKKVKAVLNHHRAHGISSSDASGKEVEEDFLVEHRLQCLECLVAALDAYEKHRDDLVLMLSPNLSGNLRLSFF